MNLAMATATAILLAGVVDDFRSRKFHNWLFLACSAVALVVVLATHGIWGAGLGIAGFTAGLVIFLPLVLLRIVGAGDMKLMAAFGLVAGWNAVLAVAFYSLFWGAAFGVLQVILKGEFRGFVRNIGAMTIHRGHQSPTELHRIPYTAALLVGWFTYLFFQGVV